MTAIIICSMKEKYRPIKLSIEGPESFREAPQFPENDKYIET